MHIHNHCCLFGEVLQGFAWKAYCRNNSPAHRPFDGLNLAGGLLQGVLNFYQNNTLQMMQDICCAGITLSPCSTGEIHGRHGGATDSTFKFLNNA